MPDNGLGAGATGMEKTQTLLWRSSPSGRGEARGVNNHIPRQKRAVIGLGGSGRLPKGGGLSGISIGGKGAGPSREREEQA